MRESIGATNCEHGPYFGCRAATANQIGLGIDWRSGILAQEAWDAGGAKYLLVSTNAKPTMVTIQNSDASIVSKSSVSEGGASILSAPPTTGMVTFLSQDGSQLGLMPPPSTKAPADAFLPPLTGGALVTDTGLNDSGGVSDLAMLWQDKSSYTSGDPMTLKLILYHFAGTVTLHQGTDAVYGLDRLKIDSLDGGGVIVTEQANGDYVLTPPATLRSPIQYTVTIHSTAPKVTSPTFGLFDGYYDYGGNGAACIDRGVVIMPRPTASEKLPPGEVPI